MLNKFYFYLVVLFFCLVFLLAIILNGLKYSFGYGFWNAHGHDAVWHLAVINQSLKSIPPDNPIFSGQKLTGYHWGYDFLLKLAHVSTGIPSQILYFQIFPIIITLSMAYLSFKLKKQDKLSSIFFIFLNFFAGSFGYIVTLFRSGQIGGESLFWSMQSISTLVNPPYALSLVILMAAIYLYQKNYYKKSVYLAVLVGFLFGLNTIIKIYASIISGLSLILVSLYQYFRKDRKHLRYSLITLAIAGGVSLFFLFIIGFSTTTRLVFRPFWFLKSLVDAYDRLYIPQISSLRFNLENQFSLIKLPILVAIYIFSLLLFVVGNMGTRVLAIFTITPKLKTNQLEPIDQLFFYSSLISFIFPLIFIQSGTPWNTIQFLYYFLFISNYYFADYLKSVYLKNKLILITIILLTIPTTLATIKSFIGFPPPATLSYQEIDALNFLKSQPNGIVLTAPHDPNYPKPNTPIPLRLYETTAYVSAFSEKITFLEDYINLDITGYDWQDRLNKVNCFFSSKDPYTSTGFLLNNQIDYIYTTPEISIPKSLPDHQLKLIYSQAGFNVYKVLK